MDQVRIGLMGSGFVTSIHFEALRCLPGAQVVAVASPSPGHAERFAAERGIPRHFTDYRSLLELHELDLVILGLPNDLHCDATCQAAAAGKHVVVEKPMAMNLAECDRMIDACGQAGVMLGYAEELCFAPKYVRLKELVTEGAFGKIHLVKQSEKHDGPHAPWFFDTTRSGGGVTFDMGCHAIEFFRWILGGNSATGKARIESVYAQMGTYVHGAKTRGDDEAVVAFDIRGRCDRPRRGELEQTRRHGRPCGGLWQRWSGVCRPLIWELPAGILASRLRIRGREGRLYRRLVVPDLSGDLELRVPPGNGAFCLMRANRCAAG